MYPPINEVINWAWVITRNETEGALGLKNVTVMEQLISDHKAVCFTLNLRKLLNERRTVVSLK